MPRHNISSRNLIGNEGQRFFNIPGVSYPKELIEKKPGYNSTKGKPYAEAPSWGITTMQAAEILNSSYSSARVLLRRKKVKFRIVRQLHSPPCTYWDRESVEKLAAKKPPLISLDESPQLKGPQEAADYLKISRSTINRAIISGFLHPVVVRINSPQGPRKRNLLRAADLDKLAKALRAKHLKQMEKEAERDAISKMNPAENEEENEEASPEQ